MDENIKISEVVRLASETNDCEYHQVKGKQILYEAYKDGDSYCFLTPYSRYHEAQGRFWVDITTIQYEVIEKYNHAFVFFRLEGGMMVMVGWHELKELLTEEYKTNNSHEGDHWKVQIYTDHIWVGRKENSMPVKAYKLDRK